MYTLRLVTAQALASTTATMVATMVNILKACDPVHTLSSLKIIIRMCTCVRSLRTLRSQLEHKPLSLHALDQETSQPPVTLVTGLLLLLLLVTSSPGTVTWCCIVGSRCAKQPRTAYAPEGVWDEAWASGCEAPAHVLAAIPATAASHPGQPAPGLQPHATP